MGLNQVSSPGRHSQPVMGLRPADLLNTPSSAPRGLSQSQHSLRKIKFTNGTGAIMETWMDLKSQKHKPFPRNTAFASCVLTQVNNSE